MCPQQRSSKLSFLAGLVLAAGLGARCAPPPGTNGNTNGQDDPCDGEATIQLSPTGQTAALVNLDCFDDLLARSEIEPTVFLQPTVEKLVKRFGDRFPNDADFLIFTLDAHRDRLRFTAVGGFNIAIRVPEAGLGPFVSVPTLSSMPNLRSYIYLARKDSLVLGPSLHEIAHGWGVRFARPEVLAAQARDSDNHWGFTSTGGQMGGWMAGTLNDLGDGQFELTAGLVEAGGRSLNNVAYAPIELYIMGLAESSEVPPLDVAVNPVAGSLFQFSADRIEQITIDDIIAANGQRVPSTADAQKAFKFALLMLTDHELAEDEWEFYQDSIDYFSFEGSADINDAFPESKYAQEPIRMLITLPDIEGSAPHYMNFFEATLGRATSEFIRFQP